MPDIRTIRYDDGRWCDQEYVAGELHGNWTVYHANGRKEWERQYAHGHREGYLRTWDEGGRLVEEMWFHLDVLHGHWRRWDGAGNEEVVGDFHFGFPRQAFGETVNPDFNALVKPHYDLEPQEFGARIAEVIAAIGRKSIRMKKLGTEEPDLSQAGSFWNHVNVLGVGEEWPRYRGDPLFPILQINCDDVALPDDPLAGFSFVTLFSAAGGELCALGEDIVVRAYRRNEGVMLVEPPCDPLDAPRKLSLAGGVISYPDENDLPPGLKVFLKESGHPSEILDQDEKLNSRVGGWPGWVQEGRVSGYGRFAFQVDSLDVENWDCGDCAVHYFFLTRPGDEFSWVQEMC